MADWKNKVDLEKLGHDILRHVANANAEKLLTLQFEDVFSGEKANGANVERKPLELSTNAKH